MMFNYQCCFQNEYFQKDAARVFIRKVLGLPFLPHEDIEDVFDLLKRKCRRHAKLMEWMNYIEKNWINSTVWPPKTWSIFGKMVGLIRTISLRLIFAKTKKIHTALSRKFLISQQFKI